MRSELKDFFPIFKSGCQNGLLWFFDIIIPMVSSEVQRKYITKQHTIMNYIFVTELETLRWHR
jgi:hypothetical protein